MPGLTNVFVNPNTKIIRDEMVTEGVRQMDIKVTGLICYSV